MSSPDITARIRVRWLRAAFLVALTATAVGQSPLTQGVAASAPATAGSVGLGSTTAPQVAGVSPTTGTAGTKVTVTGTGFTKVKQVEFGAKTSSFKVHSATKLTATAPAHALGTVAIRVVATTTSPKTPKDAFTYITPIAAYSAHAAPQVKGHSASTLGPIACGAPGSCAAVGFQDDSQGEHQVGVIDTLAAGTWTQIDEPLPQNADGVDQNDPYFSELQNFAVTCPADGSCVAVSEYRDASLGSVGVINTLADGTWTALEAPVPADGEGGVGVQLTGVSCTSTSSCRAVGTYTDSQGQQDALVDSLSNGTWTPQAVPAPADAATGLSSDNILTGISCSEQDACVAAGQYADKAGKTRRWFATLSGGTWTSAAAPVPSDVDATQDSDDEPVFSAISCATADTCAAVGTYASKSHGSVGLIDTLTPTGWSATAAPLPPNGFTSDQDGYLLSVDCGSSTMCMAVGYYQDRQMSQYGLIEQFDGQAWTATKAPLPANADNSEQVSALSSVSCPTSVACTAVGDYEVGGAGVAGDVLTLGGGSWQSAMAPAPGKLSPTDVGLTLSSVACPTQPTCNASGTFDNSAGYTQGVLETAKPTG